MVVMAEDADRSAVFDEIRNFSQRKLKKVETKVTSGSGEVITEKRGAKGVQTIRHEGIKGAGYVVDNKPDLQVGLIIPGLMISSQDVAQDKATLSVYEVTHILNLAYGVDNAFEDDYNYKKIEILDVPETDIRNYFEECFEFIDEGRRYGNCLVHCNAGVSRSTAICTAYLMTKEKMTFTDALNAIREARPFSKPNDGFVRQLQEYNDELRGSGGLKETNVDDAFTARQRAEREAEKAALISGGSSVKNKLKQFGAQLNAHFEERAKFISPIKLPLKKKTNDPTPPSNIRAPPPPPLPNNVKAPPPPPLPNNVKAPPPPPQPESRKWKQEATKPIAPKKLIINKDMNNRVNATNGTTSSPSVDETPISVKAFKQNFEMNNKIEPKVQKPANPKTNANAMTNNSWKMQTQTQTPSPAPEERKKILIKQRSKEAPDDQPKRRSTKDLIDAIEKVNNTPNSSTSGQLPYNQRRRQTTQLVNNLVDNNASNNTQPTRRRNFAVVKESAAAPPAPPPPQHPVSRTIKLMKNSSASPSPAASSPMSSARNSPQPPVHSHSPSPVPFGAQDGDPSKMVFGRVRPPRLSITGRTLSQASQTLQDVSNKVANNDSTTTSASNSRSESPVSAVVRNRNTNTTTQSNQSKSAPQEPPAKAIQSTPTANAKPISDSLANKRPTNASLNSNHNNFKNNNIKHKKACSPSSSSDEESSDEELVEKTIKPTVKSTLTMQLKPNNNAVVNNSITNDLPLTEPSHDNRYNSKRVPLGKTSGQQSFDKNRSGLNRSSSAQILKLIRSNTKADVGLDRLEEDDEIDALICELEKEGVDNIDWDELNVNVDEVKNIIEQEKTDDTTDESSDDDTSDDDDEAVHMIINRQAPQESEQSDDEFEVIDDEEDDEESK